MCFCKVFNLFLGSNYELGKMDEVLYIIVYNGFFKIKYVLRKVNSFNFVLFDVLFLLK